MSNWPTKPFRDIFKLKQGKYLTKDEMIDAPKGDWIVPVYGANGIIGYTNRIMYSRPVPLVSCRGANCGVTHLTEARSWVSNNSIACVAEDADPRFYFHLFRTTSFADVTGGSAQPQITLSSLGPKEIVCPPLETQRRIAAILGAYDDLIEVNRRRVAVLEEMARGLFEEWFVRFRFPGHETVAILDTPDGPLPEGWRHEPLGSMADINASSLRPANAPDQIGYIDIASVSPGRIDAVNWMPFSEAPGRARRKVRDGSILWSNVRPNRRSYALVTDPAPNVVASTGFTVLDAKQTSFAYLYHWVTTHDFVGYLVGNASGAAYPAVTAAVFERALILVPPPSLIEAFTRFAEPSMRQVASLQKANEKLAASRDLLLPRLISGQLSVETAERALEAAA